MSFHYPTVNYQIPLHFRLKRGEPPLNNVASHELLSLIIILVCFLLQIFYSDIDLQVICFTSWYV